MTAGDSRGQLGTARDSRGQPGKATCPDGEGLPTTLTTMVSIHPSQARVCLCEGATSWEAGTGGVCTHRGTSASTALGLWSRRPRTDRVFWGEAAADTGTRRRWSRGHGERGRDQFSQAWGGGLREAGQPLRGRTGTLAPAHLLAMVSSLRSRLPVSLVGKTRKHKARRTVIASGCRSRTRWDPCPRGSGEPPRRPTDFLRAHEVADRLGRHRGSLQSRPYVPTPPL